MLSPLPIMKCADCRVSYRFIALPAVPGPHTMQPNRHPPGGSTYHVVGFLLSTISYYAIPIYHVIRGLHLLCGLSLILLCDSLCNPHPLCGPHLALLNLLLFAQCTCLLFFNCNSVTIKLLCKRQIIWVSDPEFWDVIFFKFGIFLHYRCKPHLTSGLCAFADHLISIIAYSGSEGIATIPKTNALSRFHPPPHSLLNSSVGHHVMPSTWLLLDL